MQDLTSEPSRRTSKFQTKDLVWDILLIAVLVLAALLRFTGVNWDSTTHMHPDERFLTMVVSSMRPVESLGDLFNTAKSTLNPHNIGYGLYVYGTLPLFLVRYVGEWVGQTGYDEIFLVGRQLSAFFDTLTVLMVYLMAARLLRSHKAGVLAATFAALAVLPIQIAHYFTVDSYALFFSALAMYFAVRVMTQESPSAGSSKWGQQVTGAWQGVGSYIGFGAAFGMAMACKVNVAPLVIMLPGAAILRLAAMPESERETRYFSILRNLVLAGAAALLLFRIFQPYAFTGPGFFNLIPNEKWLNNLKELARQASGDGDTPPELQWARRPLSFSWENMLVWGLGLPLGLLAWGGFLWMGWRILRGEWRRHVLIWGWTAAYFAWQSINFTRTMRYQLLVYPTLYIIAVWAVMELWRSGVHRRIAWRKVVSAVLAIVVLAGTAAWAFAFTRIYTRPLTRVAASQWIYQNIPAAINLRIEDTQGVTNQPMAFYNSMVMSSGRTLALAFQVRESGALARVDFAHLGDRVQDPPVKTLITLLSQTPDRDGALAAAMVTDTFATKDDPRGEPYSALFDRPVQLEAGRTYYLVFDLSETSSTLEVAGPLQIAVQTPSGMVTQPLADPVETLKPGQGFQTVFRAVHSGTLREVELPHVLDWLGLPESKGIDLTLKDGDGAQIATGTVEGVFDASDHFRGGPTTLALNQPVQIIEGNTYILSLSLKGDRGALAIYGSRQAKETDWDDALPLPLEGYSPYDYNSGNYRSDLNFQMYWDDNADKLARFLTSLDQADFLFISSNRQWGTVTRVPERYPLSTAYYRALLGCPPDKDVVWCYRVAEPGMFKGALGFELVQVFESYPNLGDVQVNTQFAEEAFTVYDAPKVMIFQKTGQYDSAAVRQLLGAVDLTKVVRLTPRKAGSYPGNLMLPPDRLSGQQSGGTWSDLFKRADWLNSSPTVTVVVWYLTILLLGWAAYPFVRFALRGLPDRGYPLARITGLLLWALPVWWAGSAGIAVTRGLVWVGAGLVVLIGAALAFVQRRELAEEIRSNWRYFLLVETLGLAFFALFLLVRLGNPDLWHMYKGGEKPMDFAYFNAVLRSTTFPPYDPWFSGGYLNYYYYGFVLVGMPVKALGIVPAVAYNLILPTLFAMLLLGGFSVVWNLVSAAHRDENGEPARPYFSALMGSLFLGVFGNLGSLRMIWHGVMKLAAPGGVIDNSTIFQKIGWTVQGLVSTLGGAQLPYPRGDWYWIPSRAFPGSAITEFPAFTFLYADLHAHLISLPVTILCLSWALSIVLGKWQWGDDQGRKKGLQIAAAFALGGLAIGVLRAGNTWDFPTYLALAAVALLVSSMRHARWEGRLPDWISPSVRRLAIGLGAVALLAGLALAFYQPFSRWYGQAYNEIMFWKDEHTPIWSYWTHWGLFFFVILSLMAWETRDWMAKTPLRSLNKLRPFWTWIQAGIVLLLAAVAVLLILKVQIAWFTLPLMVWSAILLLRPGLSDAKRAALFLIGTALTLTLLVEVVVLKGDIGRMNTVFKFYLQAWTMLSLAGAACLAWIFPVVEQAWRSGSRLTWQTGLIVLVFGAGLFPALGGMDKIKDRIDPRTPHTLDGMAYMDYSTYTEVNPDTQQGSVMDLSEDARAIRWLQENVQGSPVIVEGYVSEYRWGARYAINTGLPAVLGWNWHQRQQRALTPDTWVWERVDAIKNFYSTVNRDEALAFLNKYGVRYVIVGQMERIIYPETGIQKFDGFAGDLWVEVYRDGQTVIYEVK